MIERQVDEPGRAGPERNGQAACVAELTSMPATAGVRVEGSEAG